MSGVKRYYVGVQGGLPRLVEMTPEYEAETGFKGLVHGSDYDTLRTANQRLDGEVAELKKDAERYRWLRESRWYVGPDDFYCGEGGDMNEYENHNCQAETLDAAIDAELSNMGYE